MAMSNYTSPKDWPIIRWVALAIMGFICWWVARQAGRGAFVLVQLLDGDKYAQGIAYFVAFYGLLITSFSLLGIVGMGVIEALYKFIRNE
jgi:hypothetical protein